MVFGRIFRKRRTTWLNSNVFILYTKKKTDECVVLQETDNRKLVVQWSCHSVFMLTEYSKMIGLSKSDDFQSKRVLLVKPDA